MEYPWRAKIRRAAEHLQTFEAEAARYAEAANVSLEAERDSDGGVLTIRLRADSEPPMLLGTIIGDVLHNLRSALDAIAWETCQRAGVPESKERDVSFPLIEEPSKWGDKSRRYLPRVKKEHRDVFHQLQPWYYDEQVRQMGHDMPTSLAKQRPLARLHELSNRDKHRVVNTVLARARHSWLGTPEDARIVDHTPGPWPCHPGDVVVAWRIEPPSAVDFITVGGEAILVLSEEDAEHEKSAIQVLEEIRQAVVAATRQIEVEVLEVVTPEEWAELQRLRDNIRDAENALEAIRLEPHVIDHAYMERNSQLSDAAAEARNRHAARWAELFD